MITIAKPRWNLDLGGGIAPLPAVPVIAFEEVGCGSKGASFSHREQLGFSPSTRLPGACELFEAFVTRLRSYDYV